jgi:GH24 family phage-related lysozyme (muramidase)
MVKQLNLIRGRWQMPGIQTIDFDGELHEFPDDFTDEEIGMALTGGKSNKIYAGKAAVKQVVAAEGALTPQQEHLVMLEGYASGEYSDTKGIKTTGVGQTGKFAKMPFKQVYDIHVKRAQSRVGGFKDLPVYVRQELVQAEYRGDLAGSPKFLAKLNARDYKAAAEEFLDNEDYRESVEDGTGVASRMELVHQALLRLAEEQEGDSAVV